MDMIVKTYQYRAYPTSEQVKQLHYRMWQCRKLWNQALEAKRLVYQVDDYTLTHYDLSARFCSEKKGQLDYDVLPYDSAGWVLQRLDDAYNAAFRRLKNKQPPGFPRFKGRDEWNSIPQRRPVAYRANRVTTICPVFVRKVLDILRHLFYFTRVMVMAYSMRQPFANTNRPAPASLISTS